MSSEILDDPAAVRGVIYCMEHVATGKKYVGQTRSHRLNHGRYRPFGADGRFRDHTSCAIRNTKTSQCSALYNDIRIHGKDAFTWRQLEECDTADLDVRERHWIAELHTEYPTGYNLTGGGRAGHVLVAQVGISLPLNPVGKRGGCTSRSAETRAKMKERALTLGATAEFRAARATNATAQHAAAKEARFAGVKIDSTNLDQYIFTKGARVIVRVDGREASFAGKGTPKEDNIQRAKEFLTSLPGVADVITHVASPQIATLPNCSGNP
jgi:uncharacterized protein YjbI with pentapeptide repeats